MEIDKRLSDTRVSFCRRNAFFFERKQGIRAHDCNRFRQTVSVWILYWNPNIFLIDPRCDIDFLIEIMNGLEIS